MWYSEQFSRSSIFGNIVKSLGRSINELYYTRSIEHLNGKDELGNNGDILESTHKFPPISPLSHKSCIRGVSGYLLEHSYLIEEEDDYNVEFNKEYLNIDVIDTTWMDNNVHSMRHNYFNINPTLVIML